MKTQYWAWLVTLMACGCASADPSGFDEGGANVHTQTQPLNVGWIGPISEEPPTNSMTCEPPYAAISALCYGKYCDNNYLFCWPWVQQEQGLLFNQSGGTWSPYISEEAPNNSVVCGSPGNITGVLDGMRATGSYSDNISIHCTPFLWRPGFIPGCEWTPYFSEEDTPEKVATYWHSNVFLAGVRCSGKYCDNVSYYQCHNVCTPCDSSAQCGAGFCSNGCCATG